MNGGQIAALIFAVLLLLPGGCFLYFGIGLMGESSAMDGLALLLLVIGLAIAAVIGLLSWVAFRRRPPSPGAGKAL